MLDKSRIFVNRWKGGLVILVFSLFMGMVLCPYTYAGIPEPGIVLYGKVYDQNGALVTSGELEWTFTPTGGGDSFMVTTQLTQIDVEGGPYSYRVTIPLESEVTGTGGSGDAIPISETGEEYTRTCVVKGTSITRSDTVLISKANRGTFEHVSIGSPAIIDDDNDGLDDTWEQAIVDADPNDGITSKGDVLPGDDFDSDGETNATEFYNGTDPTDAFSTYSYENTYRAFHFEIYRGAEQGEAGDFTESFWGAKLICWPRDGEEIESGSLTKPGGSGGEQVITLHVTEQGDEASMEETEYNSLSELMGDYVAGEYRITLVMNHAGSEPYNLRFKIKVDPYAAENFPDYVTIESPSPGETDVPVAPLLEFNTGMWDYLDITMADNGGLEYFHYRDNGDIPATTHQVPESQGLGWILSYLLGVDTNRWGHTWLGSQTVVAFTTIGQECYGDFEPDGDVDGLDLSDFIVNGGDLESFANDYGKTGCKTP